MSLRLREKLLSLLSPSEEKPSPVKAPAPIITVREEAAEGKRDAEKTPAPNGNGAPMCPKCGIPLVEIAANILRCQQCGLQSKTPPRRAAVPPIIGKRTASPSECSVCGSSLLQAVGGGTRCGQCGHQIVERHATGLSRAALESYDGKPPTPHLQMNTPSFFRALAWMRAFGGR